MSDIIRTKLYFRLFKNIFVGFTATFQLVSNRMDFLLSNNLENFRRTAETESRRATEGEGSFTFVAVLLRLIYIMFKSLAISKSLAIFY